MSNQTSTFLLLPGEIRNLIYIYALSPHEIHIWNQTHSLNPTRPRSGFRGPRFIPPHLLSLLSVCRQIYLETRLLPFSLNTFIGHAHSSDDFSEGKVIRQEARDVVREVRWIFFVLTGLVDPRARKHFEEGFRKIVGLMGEMRGLERVVLEVRVRLVQGWDVEGLLGRLEGEAREVMGKREGKRVKVEVVLG